jgi:hypothetical protein
MVDDRPIDEDGEAERQEGGPSLRPVLLLPRTNGLFLSARKAMSNNEPTIAIALDELSKLQTQINELSTDPEGEQLAELRHRRETLVKALSSLLWATGS